MQKPIRLDKYLSDALAVTRSEGKKMIKKGLVQVNAQTVQNPEAKVIPGADTVTADGKAVHAAAQYVYYLLNKPAGYVSATEDGREKTVLELVPEEPRRKLFPVGRLDKDTEGLLLITDDGPLAHELLSPKKHVDKTYFARVEGRVTEEDIRQTAAGLDIGEEKPTLPAKLEILRVYRAGAETGARPFAQTNPLPTGEGRISETGADTVGEGRVPEAGSKTDAGWVSEIRITIHEGKFHQVKRMMEALGKKVTYLKRLSMGPLHLPDDLYAGACRPLTRQELEKLKTDNPVKAEKTVPETAEEKIPQRHAEAAKKLEETEKK